MLDICWCPREMVELLEGYFFVHDFSNRENIIFSLHKVVPHVKDWWETYHEKNESDGSEFFWAEPTWVSFVEALKEQYYPIDSYDGQYTIWTTLQQEREQTMPT